MQKILNLIFFLCAFSIQAQDINLTIGKHLYSYVSDVLPLENGDWLVVADVSDIDNGYQIRPRLLRVSDENSIEWSVTLPPSYFDYSTIALRYDSLLQQCYVIHRRNECDLIGPDVIYAFDMDGNLLWTDSPEAEFIISLDNSSSTIAMVPEEGLFLLGDGSFSTAALRFKDASGTFVREYSIDGPVFSGVYYWREDTLLLTRENRLLYATYDEESMNIFSEQVLTDDHIQTLHVLNDSVIYSQYYNTVTRFDYLTNNGEFLADTTVEVPTTGFIYDLFFDDSVMLAAGGQSVFTYTHDLRERTEHQLNIPGTQIYGAAFNDQDLVVYGNTVVDGEFGLYPREGFLYSISDEPPLNRDLELTYISSTGVIREESPFGGYISTFDSIRATVYNAGMDTVSSLHVKIQKRASSFICPGFIGLNESFQDLQLLPGDSISLFLGSLTGYNILNNTLCAWVGTEASSLETDFTNNTSCTEVDIINAVDTPSSLPSLSVYPNPTSDFLYFNNTDQWQYYQLFDARGVLLRQAFLPTGEVTVQLGLADLPVGLYHLVLDGPEGRAQTRVVKE